jgi:hypothetical protein
MAQNQIGSNTTSSSPFVVPGDVIYFQGTDNKLWKVNSDGSGQLHIGNNTTSSTPFVTPDGWVWFRGTDNKLFKVFNDGTQQSQPGHNETSSMPFVVGEWVYFRGTDDKLFRMKTDGSAQNQIGHNTTSSTPFVTPDGWVWFQGTNNKLWKVFNDGTQQSQPGNNETSSMPFVVGEWVYFRGTDDKLFRMKTDGSAQNQIGHNTTSSTPFVTPDGWVYFQGTNDKLWRVFNDGTQQSQLDGNTTASMPVVGRVQIAEATVGEWVYFQGTNNKLWRYFVPVQALATGTARPKYYVLTLIYAPPGTNGGKSGSQVEYSSGSTTGTTTSTSSSFKAGADVSASGGLSLFGIVDLSTSGDFNYAVTTTDTSSVEITKSQTYDIKVPGPSQDGINHDEDLFVLLLNPLLGVAIYPENNILWNMGLDGQFPNTANVYTGWLKNPSLMAAEAAGVKKQLDAAGLTASDYAQILSLNPFASAGGAINPVRFLPLGHTLNYEPPYLPGDTPPPQSYTLQNTVNVTNTESVQTQYGVNVTVSSGIDLLFTASLKVTGTLEWTNTNTYGASNVSQQSAIATIGGPAYGYGGPIDVLLYWDTIYNSFMFAFPSQDPTCFGTAVDASAKPVAYKAVVLTVAGRTFQASTGPRGDFRFYGAPAGKGSVTLDGHSFQVATGKGAPKATIRLP